MKIAMIETGGWGGIAHYAWNLCEALARTGASVTLLTNARYELDALPRRFAIDPCFSPADRYPLAARTLWRRLQLLAPDVVHVQSLLSSRFDALLWPLVARRWPLVMTAHNVRSHERLAWESFTTWRSLAAARAVIVHTTESADAATARLGPRSRVAVIHHGDYAFFESGATDRRTARAALGLPQAASIILCFGAIRPYKGLLEMIGALPDIRRRRPRAHLVVAGPLLVGTDDEYREAIRRAGVEDAVTFRPQYVEHAQVASYFAAADVAVYNYRDVTDSGSLRIACHLGTPIVASAVGSFREFLTDGVSARLVPAGSVEVLAGAIADVLDDPAAAAKMAAAARALADSQWMWRDAAAATVALYQDIVRGG